MAPRLPQVAPNTPADTDHVPSFAAKMFVVREAPQEYYPPGYKPTEPLQRSPATVEVPRTKFFCEEQRYLPGLYADTQLGCKVSEGGREGRQREIEIREKT